MANSMYVAGVWVDPGLGVPDVILMGSQFFSASEGDAEKKYKELHKRYRRHIGDYVFVYLAKATPGEELTCLKGRLPDYWDGELNE